MATILPEYAPWFAKVSAELAVDERVGRVAIKKYGDIPLTMERNKVVLDAKEGGFDVIVMLDSDNLPDMYVGRDANAKPFVSSSFDFLYERGMRGLPTVVCAPYCGPPPHPVRGGIENVYVFYASQGESEVDDPDKLGAVTFEAYSREHASIMRGIQSCAAGPTGLIMYSTDAFDLMPVHGMTDEEILLQHAAGKLSTQRASQLLRMESWFFYEYTDRYQSRKASTEDVTNTREIQFAGIAKHGEPVVFCNWDAWACHMKPKCVGKPQPLKLENVSNLFREVVENGISHCDSVVDVDLTGGEPLPPGPTPEQVAAVLAEKPESDGPVEPEKPDEAPECSPEAEEALLNQVQKITNHLRVEEGSLRVYLLNDSSGRLARSLSKLKFDYARVYAYAAGPFQRRYVGIRYIGSDPMNPASAMDFSPMELDLVIVDAYGKESINCHHFVDKHLRPGGFTIRVWDRTINVSERAKPRQVSEGTEDGWGDYSEDSD